MSIVSSGRQVRTCSGSPTSPMWQPGLASCTSPSSSTLMHGASSAGGYPGPRTRASCSTRWNKPSMTAGPCIAEASFITATEAASTSPSSTPNAWPRRASSPPWAVSAIATTTRWPRRSTASTRPKSSTGVDRGDRSRRSSSPPSNGWIGSTTGGSWSPSATSRRPKPRSATSPYWKSQPWRRDSNQTASGKPGAVHIHLLMSSYATMLPLAQAGKLRVLAVTSRKRVEIAADTPTVAEAGYPYLGLDSLIGMYGPRGMSMALREGIAADVRAIVEADPTIATRLGVSGQVVDLRGPHEFAAGIKEIRDQLAAIAQTLGMKAAQ